MRTRKVFFHLSPPVPLPLVCPVCNRADVLVHRCGDGVCVSELEFFERGDVVGGCETKINEILNTLSAI